MTVDDRYTVFGVYLSGSVANALEDHLYDAAGVLDLESYFEEMTDTVPVGDPGADATDEVTAELLEGFPDYYDEAPFEAVESVPADGFVLVRLAATPTRATGLRERFQAAATIRETDLRTIQTAILAAYLAVEPVGSD